MKVYIAGPISLGGTLSRDEVEANFAAFYAAEDHLRALGHEPANPLRVAQDQHSHPWSYYLRLTLVQMLDCDAYLLLPGWEASRGVRLEKHVADELGMAQIERDVVTVAVLDQQITGR